MATETSGSVHPATNYGQLHGQWTSETMQSRPSNALIQRLVNITDCEPCRSFYQDSNLQNSVTTNMRHIKLRWA
ncbi:734_t:CDS:1, partial [Acaulospora colombiana]